MIQAKVISVNLTNISISNDQLVTPLQYVLLYSPNDENTWVNLTAALTALPTQVNLTDGLISGKLHFFKLMVSNRYGDTNSSVLKVVGCKEPQTPPGIPSLYYLTDKGQFWFYIINPKDDGASRITNYTLLIQNWRTFDRADDSIAQDIYSVYAEKGFSGSDYGSFGWAAISSNYLGFPPEPGFEYRVYITASYNDVGKGPGQSEYLQFFVPSIPIRMPPLSVRVIPNYLYIEFDTPTREDAGYIVPTNYPEFIMRYEIFVQNLTTNEWISVSNQTTNNAYIKQSLQYYECQKPYEYSKKLHCCYSCNIQPGKQFNFRVVPSNWFSTNRSVYSEITAYADKEPDPLQSFTLKNLTGSYAILSYVMPLSDGGDPIIDITISWDQFNGTWTSFNITPSSKLFYNFTYLGGQPFPTNTPVSFSALCWNRLGNSTLAKNLSFVTYDFPRNVSQPFIDVVEEKMVRINWTNVNQQVLGPITHYLVKFTKADTVNWVNLTSASAPNTTLKLYYEHRFNFTKKTRYLYQLCPVNAVGLGPCSEPINVYSHIDTNLSSPFPKVIGKVGGSSVIKFVDFNNARDVIAIGWKYQVSSINYAIVTVYRGDRYYPEWEKVISDTNEISAVRHSPDGLKMVVMMTTSEFHYLNANNGTVIAFIKLSPLEQNYFPNGRNLILTNGINARIFVSYSACGDEQCESNGAKMYNLDATGIQIGALNDVYRGQTDGSSVIILQDQVDSAYVYLFAVWKEVGSIDFSVRNTFQSTVYYDHICQNCSGGSNVIASTSQINATDKVVVMVDQEAKTYMIYVFNGGGSIPISFTNKFKFTQDIIASVDTNLAIQVISMELILHVYQSCSQMYLAKLNSTSQTIGVSEIPTVYQTYMAFPLNLSERFAIFIQNSTQFLFVKHGAAFEFPHIKKSGYFEEQVGMIYSFDQDSNCQFYGDNYYKDGDPKLYQSGLLSQVDAGSLSPMAIDFLPVTTQIISPLVNAEMPAILTQNFQINEKWCSLSTQYSQEVQTAPIIQHKYRQQQKRVLPIGSHPQKCTPILGGYGSIEEEPLAEVRQANGSAVPSWVSYDIATYNLILSNQSWQEQQMIIVIRGKCKNHQVIFARTIELKPPGRAPYFETNMTELVTVPFNRSFSFMIPKLICENLFENITIIESGTQLLPQEFTFNQQAMQMNFVSRNVSAKRNFQISIISLDQLNLVTNVTFSVHVKNEKPYFKQQMKSTYTVFFNSTEKISAQEMFDYENSPLRIACFKPPYIDCSSGSYIYVDAMKKTSIGTYTFLLNVTDEMDPTSYDITIQIIAPQPYFKEDKLEGQKIKLYGESKINLSKIIDDNDFKVDVEYFSEGMKPLPGFFYTVGNELYAIPKIEDVGEYKLEVYLYNWHSDPTMYQLNITVPPLPPNNQDAQDSIKAASNLGYPEFSSSLSDLEVVQCNTTVYVFPNTTDLDNDNVTIANVNFGLASNFSVFNPLTKAVVFYPKTLQHSQGSPYTISVTLSDDNKKFPLQKTYLMKLSIVNPTDITKVSYKPCIVDPRKGVIVPPGPGGPEPPTPPPKVKPQDVTIKITKVNQAGRISIRVQPPIEEIMSQLNQSNIKVVNTKQLRSPLNYSIVEIDQSRGYIYLQLNYTDIANLSIISQDQIETQITKKFAVVDSNGQQYVLKPGITARSTIPKQANPDQLQSLKGKQATIGSFASIFAGLSGVQNIWAQSAIVNIYSTFDALSFLSVIHLVDVDIPQSVQFVMKIVFDMAQFNVLPYNGTEKSHCTFAEGKDEAYSDKLEQLGFQSHNFILNADSCMQVYLLYIAVLASRKFIFLPILRALERRKMLRRFQIFLRWCLGDYSWQQQVNGLFILTKQFYQTIAISCILHFHRFSNWNLSGEVLASIYALIFAALILLLPFIYTMLWVLKHPIFDPQGNRSWCQHLFENLRFEKKRVPDQFAPLWEILKMWRILINACGIIFFKGQCILQLLVLLMTSIAAILFIIIVKPFRQGGWRLEAAIEIAQVLYCFLMVAQKRTAYKGNIERTVYEREFIGQWQLGLIALVGMLGLFPLILSQLLSLIKWIQSHFEEKPVRKLDQQYHTQVSETSQSIQQVDEPEVKTFIPYPPEPMQEHRKPLPIEYGPCVFAIEGSVDAGNDMRDYQDPDAHKEEAEPKNDSAVFANNRDRQKRLRFQGGLERNKFADKYLVQNTISDQKARYALSGSRPEYKISDYSDSVYRDDQSSYIKDARGAGDSRSFLWPWPQLQRENRWLKKNINFDKAKNSTIDIHDINAELKTPSNREIDSGFSRPRQSFDQQLQGLQKTGSTLTPKGLTTINRFRRSVCIDGGLDQIHGSSQLSSQRIHLPPIIISQFTEEECKTSQIEENLPPGNAEPESDEQLSLEERKSEEQVKKRKKNKQKKLKGAGKLKKRLQIETMPIYNNR
ncbi:hypothetical protein FGO68_gene5766 [Halteria grandinella]|uniref:Fibronectin type-III domain-containing protein n=1 Tax=Halteria grandinella TaxID=5974 RepID=A0A8J8P5R4_HALGN|nr:hypothetical protein FGO68_gene5766 [Halteria grandinella]